MRDTWCRGGQWGLRADLAALPAPHFPSLPIRSIQHLISFSLSKMLDTCNFILPLQKLALLYGRKNPGKKILLSHSSYVESSNLKAG